MAWAARSAEAAAFIKAAAAASMQQKEAKSDHHFYKSLSSSSLGIDNSTPSPCNIFMRQALAATHAAADTNK